MIRTLEKKLSPFITIPERFVDQIGMYRMVTLALSALVMISIIAGAVDWLAYGVVPQLVSLSLALGVCLCLNILLASLWGVAANHESAVITALILFFLAVPDLTPFDGFNNWPLVAASVAAIASKYVISYRRQHILNPAAVGAVLVAVGIMTYNFTFGTNYTSDIFQWWVANPTLFWPLVVIGSLVVFKIRRWPMVLSCIVVGAVVFVGEGVYRFDAGVYDSLQLFFVSFPVLFLAFFMLTEPFTTPPMRRNQMIYGALVGVLSSTVLFAEMGLPMTPELALVVGNMYAYTYRIRQKLYLKLLSKRQVAEDTWEFTFTKPDKFSFQAGQYLEWMLPHEHPDSRGPRRYFTIASSPTESVVRLALKVVPEGGSTYKDALLQLDEGECIIASQLAGDFVLPKNIINHKLGFIAGGIGVTPFSSHLRYMHDSDQMTDTHLYYCTNAMNERAYIKEFSSYGPALQVVSVIGAEDVGDQANVESGYITVDMLERRTPDWRERTWYISGPPAMVNAYYNLLRDGGLPKKQIKKDFFPGLA